MINIFVIYIKYYAMFRSMNKRAVNHSCFSCRVNTLVTKKLINAITNSYSCFLETEILTQKLNELKHISKHILSLLV